MMKKFPLAVTILCLCINYALAVNAQPAAGTGDYNSNQTDAAQKLQITDQQKIISTMRDKWRDNFIPNAEMDSASLAQYLPYLTKSSNQLWEKLDKQITIQKLWSDTVLDNKTDIGKLKLGTTLYTIYQRIFILAKAWMTPGTDLYHDPQLLAALTNILTKLNTEYYNASSPEWGNWWHWELGISRSVNNTLIILYDHLPASLIEHYNQATRHFVANPVYLAEGSGAPYSTTKNVFTSTGGNRIDSAQVVFVRGLLENNANEITAAVQSLPAVLHIVESGDGFYADGSFIQHKDLPYTGTYGQVLLNGLGLIKNNVANTPWDFSSEENQKIYKVINDTFLPWLYQGNMSDAVNGRSISRSNGQDRDVGISVINAVALFVDGAQEKEKQFLKAFLKAQLTPKTINYYQNHLPENLQAWQLINSIAMDNNVKSLPMTIGGKLFSDMDRLIYRGKNYQTVIAMHSSRTGSYECINGENLRGQRTADGMMYLSLPEDEQYRGYWALVDSQHLPGTTSAGKQGWCDEQYRSGQLGRANIHWAGGVVLDQFASASMQLKVSASSLKAKKSWFMTPDFIVMLGSGISANELPVTTIANRKISDQAKVLVNGVDLLAGGKITTVANTITLQDQGKQISWQPLQQQSDQQKVIISRSHRQGDWADIGTSTGKVAADFLLITQPHQTPATSDYGWIIYPNQQITHQPTVNVLANSSSVQAIALADKTIYANFWKAGKVNDIQALTPLAMIMRKTTTGLRIAVSSPRREQRVSLVIGGNYLLKQTDTRASRKGNILSVDMSHLRGGSYVFDLLITGEMNK